VSTSNPRGDPQAACCDCEKRKHRLRGVSGVLPTRHLSPMQDLSFPQRRCWSGPQRKTNPAFSGALSSNRRRANSLKNGNGSALGLSARPVIADRKATNCPSTQSTSPANRSPLQGGGTGPLSKLKFYDDFGALDADRLLTGNDPRGFIAFALPKGPKGLSSRHGCCATVTSTRCRAL
jgi:hypothetical protein